MVKFGQYRQEGNFWQSNNLGRRLRPFLSEEEADELADMTAELAVNGALSKATADRLADKLEGGT